MSKTCPHCGPPPCWYFCDNVKEAKPADCQCHCHKYTQDLYQQGGHCYNCFKPGEATALSDHQDSREAHYLDEFGVCDVHDTCMVGRLLADPKRGDSNVNGSERSKETHRNQSADESLNAPNQYSEQQPQPEAKDQGQSALNEILYNHLPDITDVQHIKLRTNLEQLISQRERQARIEAIASYKKVLDELKEGK